MVNEEKTELCLFYKTEQPTIELAISGKIIKSKKSINVLGIVFNSQMKWNQQVAQAINKSKRALHGIKLIRKYLTKDESKMLLTSNFYSILYYNCEVWLSEGLNSRHKQQLLAASANALKILNNVSDLRISFIQLHNQEKRALPMNFAKYRLAIQLFKIYNGNDYNDDWLDMNRQQNFNARCDMFQISNCSNIKIGRNIMCNRLTVLNRQIKLDWLNLSLTAFKLKSKLKFLAN